MTDRLHHLTTHATDLHAHSTALAEITALFAATLPPPPPASTSPAATRTNRAKSIAATTTTPTNLTLSAATQQLLRHLDIAVPPSAALPALAPARLERAHRLLSHLDASQRQAVCGVADAVGRGAVEVQELLEALFVNSAYKTVDVTKGAVEERVAGLERGVGEVSKCMGGVGERMDVAGGGDDGRGKRRERAWVGRWGDK